MEQLYVQLVTRLGWYALVNGNLSFGASIDRWISAKSWNGGVARGVRISYVCMHEVGENEGGGGERGELKCEQWCLLRTKHRPGFDMQREYEIGRN